MIMVDKPQLRGKKLLDAIEVSLRQLAREKENYVYNASELSRRVGCSRPTLDSKAEFIDKVLTKLGAEKRLKKDHPLFEHLYTRIEQLETDKKILEKELNALREHHVQIYSTLYMQSVDVALLVQPFVRKESVKKGKCILCDQAITDKNDFGKKNTVINIDDHKKKDS